MPLPDGETLGPRSLRRIPLQAGGFLLLVASFAAFAFRNGARGNVLELAAYGTVAAACAAVAWGRFRSGGALGRSFAVPLAVVAGVLALNGTEALWGNAAVSAATAANLLWAWGFTVASWHAGWAVRRPQEADRRRRGVQLGLVVVGLAYVAYLVIVSLRAPEPLLFAGHGAGLLGVSAVVAGLGSKRAGAS